MPRLNTTLGFVSSYGFACQGEGAGPYPSSTNVGYLSHLLGSEGALLLVNIGAHYVLLREEVLDANGAKREGAAWRSAWALMVRALGRLDERWPGRIMWRRMFPLHEPDPELGRCVPSHKWDRFIFDVDSFVREAMLLHVSADPEDGEPVWVPGKHSMRQNNLDCAHWCYDRAMWQAMWSNWALRVAAQAAGAENDKVQL